MLEIGRGEKGVGTNLAKLGTLPREDRRDGGVLDVRVEVVGDRNDIEAWDVPTTGKI